MKGRWIMKGGWTKEKIAVLRAMWRDGQSGGTIAAALGCTRNAVLGKIRRLGLNRKIEEPPAPSVMSFSTCCQWIYGHPNGQATKYCGQPATKGTSWCPRHYERVFERTALVDEQRRRGLQHISTPAAQIVEKLRGQADGAD